MEIMTKHTSNAVGLPAPPGCMEGLVSLAALAESAFLCSKPFSDKVHRTFDGGGQLGHFRRDVLRCDTCKKTRAMIDLSQIQRFRFLGQTNS
jgi:hypothetical protein